MRALRSGGRGNVRANVRASVRASVVQSPASHPEARQCVASHLEARQCVASHPEARQCVASHPEARQRRKDRFRATAVKALDGERSFRRFATQDDSPRGVARILALLVAEPMLDAAFFRYEPGRLVLTLFAYVLVVLGLTWVMVPYKLRDQINWFSKTSARWCGINVFGFVYGVALIALALTRY